MWGGGGNVSQVWWAFLSSGINELIRYAKLINAKEYINILKKSLQPTINTLFSPVNRVDIIFQYYSTHLPSRLGL